MQLPEVQTRADQVVASLSWLLLLVIVTFIVHASLWPPAVVPATAAATEFSSARAMRTLAGFTERPHPVGSPEHERVRQYLSGQMQALGLDPAVQTHTGVEGTSHRINAARVSNLVGRLKGTDSTRAVMLVAHYDSVDRAPGAGDDGGGVAAILETVRAIKAGPPLRNDVIVLLTNGEELGLLGARAVAVHDPWLQQVGVMFNLEGRGDRGPAQMFETSEGNSNLIREFVKAAPYKTGSSLLYTIYKHLPNDTDYTIFKAAGVAGLNFARVERWESYHTRLDTPENLDQRGLQQEGSNALELTRSFGNLDLNRMQTTGVGDEVYFNIFRTWMVHYPGWLVAPLAGLLTLALAIVLLSAVRRRQISTMNLLGATGVALLLVLATTLAGIAVFLAEHLLFSRRMQMGDTPANTLFFLAILLCGTAVWLALFRFFRKRLGTRSLFAAGCLLAWLLTMLMTFTLPLASYLIFWPLVFATLGLALKFRMGKGNGSMEEATIAWFCAMPTLLLLSPTIYFFFVALFLAPPVAVICGFTLGLGLLLITPLANLLVPSRAPVWMLLLAGATSFAVGGVLSRPSAKHPEPDTLIYRLDANTGKAEWATFDKAVDPWTAKLMTTSPKPGKLIWPGPVDLDGLVTEAPPMALAAPELTLVSSTRQGDVRIVQMQLTSARRASWLHLQLPSAAEVLGATVDSEEAQGWPRQGPADRTSAKLPWALNLYGYNASGVALTLRLKGDRCSATLTDQEYGLPAMVEARPADRMPWYGSDYTVVTRRVALC